MNENERIVCEFLRKIAPPREWEYLGEVEHYWIGELCGELNDQLKAENAKLRELVQEMYGFVKDVCELRPDVLMVNNVPDWQVTDYRTPSERYAEKLHELGIEVE